MREPRVLLPNLTALRFFAAGMVLLHHLYGRPAGYRPWYDAWFDGGYQGVNLFFVLSGFLLAYQAADGPVGLKRFYARRFSRVYPLYVAALAWGLPNFWRHGTYARWEVLGADLLLVQSWFGRQFSMQLDAPSWSLSTEVFFYAMFPLLLPWVRRGMGRWKTWVVVAAVLAMVAPAVLWWARRATGNVDAEWGGWIVCFPVLRLGEFVVGMVCGLRFQGRMPRVSGVRTAGAAALVVGLLGCGPWLGTGFLRNGLLAVPFAMLVYCLAGWRSGWLRSAPMQLLGEISYGIYLLQFPLLFTINVLLPQRLRTRGMVAVWELALILPVAFVFYVVVEKPGRRLLLGWLAEKSHAKPIETPQAGLV